jgi:hypothetical protein
MVEVEGRYFFVEWHTISDLMGLKHSIGLEGEGSQTCPCPICPAKYGDFTARVNNPNLQPLPNRLDMDPIFPIPMSRQHGCCMHAHHRIVERILLELVRVSGL